MVRDVDAVVIGAGPAGLAAALGLEKGGAGRVVVIERERDPGGILLQCIHSGFGLHKFREELTGPEYAERYIHMVRETGTRLLSRSIVLDILNEGDRKSVMVLSEESGLIRIECKAVVLAMGCRERSAGSLKIAGGRPGEIMTAGFAQRLVNMEGYLPGREVVILGSGDIGLIMARRLVLEGVQVRGVVEIKPYPGGLIRNVVQCLHDFRIPLYLSHTVAEIHGDHRIRAVAVCPVDEAQQPLTSRTFVLPCDCLLLSAGLIPENELSLRAGVELHAVTGGPLVNADLMTSVPGIFACGNVLHVHDLVDYVSEEAEYCGSRAALFCSGLLPTGIEVPVRAGKLVRYVLPGRVRVGNPAVISLRSTAPIENALLLVQKGEKDILRRKIRKVMPGSMLRVPLTAVPEGPEGLDVSLETEEK